MNTCSNTFFVAALCINLPLAHGNCVPKKRAAAAAATEPVAPSPNAAVALVPPRPIAPSWPAESPIESHLTELRHAGQESFRTNRVPKGRSERYGHAETIVRAAASAVLVRTKDYAHYKELAPRRFRAASVLEMNTTGTDVYLEVPMIGGLVVLWQVLRFAPVATLSKSTKRVEGIFVRGNVSDAHVVFDIIQTAPNETLLTADLLITLPFAAPGDKIDEELRDAAADAIRGIREQVEAAAPAPH